MVTRPLFSSLPSGELRLEQDYETAAGFGWAIVVPSGFITDGASIPRIGWLMIGPPIRGKYFRAALVHDYLCTLAQKEGSYTLRVIADAMFLHFLKLDGVSWWKRSLMYVAVRCWGRFTYKARDTAPLTNTLAS